MKFSVTFPSKGLLLAADLHVPDDYVGHRLPAVVLAHPLGGVKEQTAGLYARRLAREGLAALAFDAAYQGASEGEPRGLEDPFQRVEDIRCAVSYLSTRDDVDPQRIGALGICASGGYVPYAAQTDRRIKAVATVSALDFQSMCFEGLGRTNDPEVADVLLEQAGRLRNAEARGDGIATVPNVPETEAETRGMPTLVREAWEYYRTPRGGHPRSTNSSVRRMDQIAHYNSYTHINMIAPRPILMIAGTEADTRYVSEEAIEKAGEPKELFLVQDATHVDLYDKPEYVQIAVTRLAEFFHKNLT